MANRIGQFAGAPAVDFRSAAMCSAKKYSNDYLAACADEAVGPIP
jgi:hypothetical protein